MTIEEFREIQCGQKHCSTNMEENHDGLNKHLNPKKMKQENAKLHRKKTDYMSMAVFSTFEPEK